MNAATTRTARSVLLPLALLVACSPGPEAEPAAIPGDLAIRVEIDGRELPAIDASRLGIAPDVEDEHRLAWRLQRLVPQLADASQLVVEQRDGQRVVLPLGEDGQPVAEVALLLNRKGEVVLASLDPQNPFPAFHGRGGNRGRAPGEERIRDPHWLRLRSRRSERRSG